MAVTRLPMSISEGSRNEQRIKPNPGLKTGGGFSVYVSHSLTRKSQEWANLRGQTRQKMGVSRIRPCRTSTFVLSFLAASVASDIS